MVATRVVGPQLRFGETLLDDAHLLQLLDERDAAKVAYEDAKGYLVDYVEGREFLPGEYRVGKYRIKVGRKSTLSVTVPTR